MCERRGIGIGKPAAPRFSGQAEEVTRLGKSFCEIGILLRGTCLPSIGYCTGSGNSSVADVYYSIETREIISSSGLNVKIKEYLELIFNSYLSHRHNECSLLWHLIFLI